MIRLASLAALLLAGCTALVDTDGYTFQACEPGTLRCECLDNGQCLEEGLECRTPGLCVRPPDAGIGMADTTEEP